MSTSVMLSLLSKGNTGNELLSILDAIVADSDQQCDANVPLADVIEF